MDAVSLPALNPTPVQPGGKPGLDSPDGAGFPDAMAAAADAKPAPSGGRAHISPIAAPGSAIGKPGDGREPRATGRGPDVPPRTRFPGGIPGKPFDPVARLPEPRPGGPRDPLQADRHDTDVPDPGAQGVVAGVLSMLAGGTPGALPGRIGPSDAKAVRMNSREAGTPVRGRSDASEAAPELRKPADASQPAGASRHQLQRLQQFTATRASGASPTPTPVDPAAIGKHPLSRSSASSLAATAAAGAAAMHATGDSAPPAAAALFDFGSVASAHTPAGTNAAPPATAVLATPMGSMAWPRELGQQLVQMVQRGTGQVDLHLNPRELGPIQISLQVHDQSAQVHFLVAHADVQHAVQQALPQLREALAGQGIALGNALVGQQQQQPSGSFGGSAQAQAWSGGGSGLDDVAPVRTATISLPAVPGTGVDLYA